MAFALHRKSSPHFDSAPVATLCRVHTCVRCQSGLTSRQPCSFVPAMGRACAACSSQEHVLVHLPASRTPWGAALARTRRI
jgi:hypothetical protein